MNTILLSEELKQYWVNELKLPLSGWNLYTDYPRHREAQEMITTTFALDINRKQLDMKQRAVDIHVWMMTCYSVLLYRMSGEQDQIVGVNGAKGGLLPLRLNVDGNISFQEMYQQVLKKYNDSQALSVSLSEIEAMVGHAPLLETIYGEDQSYTASSLNWHVKLKDDQWQISISYDKHVFKAETMIKLAAHFERVVATSLLHDEMKIASVDILVEEDQTAYSMLNATARELPQQLDIPSMLKRTVSKYSERIALSTEGQQISYGQLDQLSNKVAHMLIQKGLPKGGFVSIFMERSIEAVIAMLGTLKAGGTYVPLDPEHPDDRSSYIIGDTDSYMVITKEYYLSRLAVLLEGKDLANNIFCIDKGIDIYSDTPVDVTVDGNDTAYVIYTSGTTGKPKGVLIPHIGVVNLALDTVNHLQMTEQDVILQYSTFSFDASVYDIFSSLCSGSRLHLLMGEERFSTDLFTSAIQYTGATRIGILPTVFFNQLSSYIRDEDVAKYVTVKSLVIGGEALNGEVVRNFQQKLRHQLLIVNAYGPTEVSVVTTTHSIDYAVPEHISSVCIGNPISNYEVLIVNEHNQICPMNVVGELLIHSVGLAKGYLNQPEMTEKAFVVDPINPESGKRYYRSGDLVALQSNGIQYMGRRDLQVKIRGYRIEIGEIEDNLSKHEGIKDAVVIPKSDQDGNKMLVAFYTSKAGQELAKNDLVQFLRSKVPTYMVPSYFSALDVMPISPTGKIDRKALALYEINAVDEMDPNYVAPENEMQREIAEAWQQAIHRTYIGIHDNFFECGGSSLKILEILVKLKPKFPQLRINDFFSYPTIAEMAQRLSASPSGQQEHDLAAGSSVIVDLAEYPQVFCNKLSERSEVEPHQKSILLTGATGYLGSSLLHELLNTRDDAVIYCLVRSTDGSDPRERLSDAMSAYFGEGILEKLENQVIVVQGDLEQEGLGLTPVISELLRQQLDSIIHCGAEVKHFGDPAYFNRVNVSSTQSLLELIAGKPDARFHYVSTLGIPEELMLSGQWDQFSSNPSYDHSVNLENVYTNSKLEAEKLVVRTCQNEGIASTIYRVGNLSCHSKTGVFQRNIDSNAFYRMLKAMILLKKAPSVQWQVDITPIDYAGASIAALALDEKTVGRVFHICNPVQISYIDLVDGFRQYGYEIDMVDLPVYEAWLLDSTEQKDVHGLELAMAQFEGDGAKNSPYRYTCPQTEQYLSSTSIKCHEPDSSFIKRMIDHAVDIGYFSAP